MIERILPPEVVSVASRNDDMSTWLYPEEAEQIRGAVDKRLREFSRARTCARLALDKLGLTPGPILRGPAREPVWPSGIVGSITHCRGYCAAAVARQADILAVGIDAEPDESLPEGVLDQIAGAGEREWLATAPSGVHWDRLLFSAKESVFKAWFPLMRTWLDFDQAHISFDPTGRRFEARLLVPSLAMGDVLIGRFQAYEGLLLTALVVKPPQA